jgi:hypothetical protein
MRAILIIEAAVFALAASAHFRWSISGYEHARAATAESVIAAALLLGLALTLAVPSRLRLIGLAAQLFALIGTLVGAAMVVIGVGPQSAPDWITHGVMLVLLGAGILTYLRYRPAA